MWTRIEVLEEKHMSAGIRDSMMALLLCVLVCSLGRASSPQSCQQWQPPVPLGEVNSSGFNDKSPFLSFDGLTLYFSRENEPAGYLARLYQATRETPDGLFGDVREIIPLTDGGGHVSCPWVSADGLRMYYYSTSGLRRWLRMSQRGGVDESWPRASYVSELNALGSLANPTLTEDERVIVFSGLDLHGGRGGWDLWMASRPDRDSPFSDVTNLRTLNTTSWDMHPSITPDGLVLYFGSNRSGRFQIFRACRNSQESQFTHVQHMALLDTPDGMSMYPSISADGTTLY